MTTQAETSHQDATLLPAATRKEFLYWVGIFNYTHPDARIKVGWSGREHRGEGRSYTVRKRLSELQSQWSTKDPKATVSLLAVVAGTKADETSLHNEYAEYRYYPHTKEYFRAVPPLMEHLRWLRQQVFTATTFDEIDHIPTRHYDEWKPLPYRRALLSVDAELFRHDPVALFGGCATWENVLGEPPDTADEFYTNPELVFAARRVMGGIDLDPASDHMVNRRLRIDSIFTISDNGLRHPWHGRVWLNPPFSDWEAFAGKVVEELASGRVSQLCLYCGLNVMNAKYFGALKSRSSAICLGHGRWEHWGEKSFTGSPFSSGVMYFGPNVARFEDEFSKFGHIFRLSRDYCGGDGSNRVAKRLKRGRVEEMSA